MHATKRQEIRLVMNPVELRRLAKRMETLWEQGKVGDSAFVDSLHAEKDFSVSLYIDQEYFHKLSRSQEPPPC